MVVQPTLPEPLDLRLERIRLPSVILFQHTLTAGDRHCLTGLVFLLDYVEDSAGDVLDLAAASERHLCLIVAANIVDRLCARYLARVQLLYKQSLFGVPPERAV